MSTIMPLAPPATRGAGAVGQPSLGEKLRALRDAGTPLPPNGREPAAPFAAIPDPPELAK